MNLKAIFTPDRGGNMAAVTDPLSQISNQMHDRDRSKIESIDPDPGRVFRTATKDTYDLDDQLIEVDRGTTTRATGSDFTALETTTTAFDAKGAEVLRRSSRPMGRPIPR